MQIMPWYIVAVKSDIIAWFYNALVRTLLRSLFLSKRAAEYMYHYISEA